MPPAHPYSHYIDWLESRDNEVSKDYWEGYLSSYNHLSTLPQKWHASSNKPLPYRLESHQLVMGSDEVKLLEGLSRTYGVTANTVFQFAWGLLLSKYNNTDDVVFGSVVSGRPAEVKGIEADGRFVYQYGFRYV